MMRAITSYEPPAPYGVTMRIGRSGYDSAAIELPSIPQHANAAVANRIHAACFMFLSARSSWASGMVSEFTAW